jgi:hypothetical protein
MMIKISKRLQAQAAVWGVALALTGCFSDNNPAVPMAPAELGPLQAISAAATTSIMGLLQYQAAVNSSSQAAQDSAEPLDVSSIMLPTSETAEPFDI